MKPVVRAAVSLAIALSAHGQAAGLIVTPEIAVEPIAASQNLPAIATGNAASYAIWTDLQTEGRSVVRGVRLVNGVPVGVPSTLSSPGIILDTSIAWDGKRWVAAWVDAYRGEVAMQAVAADGSLDTIFRGRISTVTGMYGHRWTTISMATDGKGRILVTWIDAGAGQHPSAAWIIDGEMQSPFVIAPNDFRGSWGGARAGFDGQSFLVIWPAAFGPGPPISGAQQLDFNLQWLLVALPPEGTTGAPIDSGLGFDALAGNGQEVVTITRTGSELVLRHLNAHGVAGQQTLPFTPAGFYNVYATWDGAAYSVLWSALDVTQASYWMRIDPNGTYLNPPTLYTTGADGFAAAPLGPGRIGFVSLQTRLDPAAGSVRRLTVRTASTVPSHRRAAR